MVPLILFFALCLAAGGVGGVFTSSSVNTWYRGLQKPTWNPPNWVFGPVWTTLYILMAVAAWLVWRGGEFWGIAGFAFFVQLALNVAWSWIFFGLRRPDYALWDVAALWLSIAITLIFFWQVNVWAGLLMIPYLAWVSFASALNRAVAALNPAQRGHE